MSRILLLEPDFILANTYGQALVDQGYNVDITSSAQSAVSTADADMPDLVIVELQLIEHSGIEFLYEFRTYSDWQTIPVIVQSQIPPGEFADNWQLLKHELGVKIYLYKPQTSLQTLLNNVKELLPINV